MENRGCLIGAIEVIAEICGICVVLIFGLVVFAGAIILSYSLASAYVTMIDWIVRQAI